MQNKIKRSQVSGKFYPSNSTELKSSLEKYTQNKQQIDENIKAMIVPHAGYIFSGPVAGSAYGALEQAKNTIKKIAILSPSHYYNLPCTATSDATHFETPLGELKVDSSMVNQLNSLGLTESIPNAFEQEHALEVQLPFIQHLYRDNPSDIEIIPLIVGQVEIDQISKVITYLIEQNVFIIISADLSHFHKYQEAQLLDQQTSNKIVELAYHQLNSDMTCGYYPIIGLLDICKKNNFKITPIDLRNSGDTAGDKNQVVGYGSFMVTTI